MKPAHCTYIVLLICSIVFTVLSYYFDSFLSTVFLSVGCGGVASVIIAWIIDDRNYRKTKKENEYKFSLISDEYLKLYQRLLFVVANECHGLYNDKMERSFEEWLCILCDEKRYSEHTSPSMEIRCERVSGTINTIQEFIERFRTQSAVLIMNGYPNIDNLLSFFAIQHSHCWGVMEQLKMKDYTSFCKTTYVLYKEFIEQFPSSKDAFPEKYNVSMALPKTQGF